MGNTSGTTDPLPRIADALGEIAGRLSTLSDELRALPSAQVSAPPLAPVPEPVLPPPPAPAPPGMAPPPYPVPPMAPMPQWQPRPPQPPRPTLSEKLAKDGAGSKVLAWIGGAVTLLGVVLLLVLAIQRGWVGPVPRVLLGALLGGTLTGLGLRLHRNPAARTGAFALAATGVAVLYADIVAATTFLELIPSWGGLLLGLLVAVGGLALAGHWKAPGLAVFVLLGCAVCAPVLTSGFTVSLMTFLLILAVAAAPIQLSREWPGVVLAAGLPPIAGSALTVSFAAGSWFETGSDLGVAVLAALTSLLVLATATATTALHRNDVTPIALIAVAPLPVMLLPFLLDRPLAAAFTGGLTAVLAGLWAGGRKRLPSGVSMTAGVLASVLAFETTTVALSGETRVIVVLAEAIAFGAVAIRLRSGGMVAAGAAFGAAGLLAAMGSVASPVMLLRKAAMATDVLVTGAAVSPLIAIAAVLLAVAAFRTEAAKSVAPLVAVVAGMAVLYGAAGTVLYPARLLVDGEPGFLLGHALITVSWTVAALVLLLRGIQRKAFRVTGLVLVAAALAKLVLFDLASLDGMARVGAFLGAGLVLLAAGTRYARLVGATRSAQDSGS
ncbi:DUF2339 domain-containing protein [Amycolatopsis albispora]|uniref:DUF2339 domain-containing protein n=1 Tax=Amycolatopsis albispora TaxID=1804986 RepID=A0A344LE06_9PSEU|nr:DUF2339 domain-containing protein [Amycolatopsis albispora]AXB46280.1 hypothetical protein A4R43_30635 [Amycolatopsis albispora]